MSRSNFYIKCGVLTFTLFGAWAFGAVFGYYLPPPHVAKGISKNLPSHAGRPPLWDRKDTKGWPSDFVIVDIPVENSQETQKSYYRPSVAAERPLVVSLHTWSGDYKQIDPLVEFVKTEDWNYIHPDFRGPNWTFDACLGKKAVQDIDDAISYALSFGKVDIDNIFVVGVSGGGYAVLGNYLKTRHPIKAHFAWVPISNLKAWYLQSIQKKEGYAENIIKCTSKDRSIDFEEMERRSPLFWKKESLNTGSIEIYAGIGDGFDGSVPISHSLLFYNKIAMDQNDSKNRVSEEDLVRLLSRDVMPIESSIEDRDVIFMKESKKAKIVIFQGGHEMLTKYMVERIKQFSITPSSRSDEEKMLVQ